MNSMSCFYLGIRRKPIKSPTSSFSFPINDLPLDILLEILYKLPVKQLHCNKIICKLWSSLISDPSFPCQYSARATTPSAAFLYTRTLTKHGGESWWRPCKKYKCLASSNGLLLCTTLTYAHHYRCYVCNPLTNQWVTLPSPPSCLKRPFLFGLVCNPSSQVIKVVQIKLSPNSKSLEAEIFDFSSNQWKVHHKLTYKSKFHVFNEVIPVEIRGILYWECSRNKLVFVFDTNVDRSHLIQLPTTTHEKRFHHGKLGVSKNHLYYAEVDFQYKNKSTYRIWRLDEDRIEGKATWSLHLSSDILNDWAPKLQRRDLSDYKVQLLGIGPLDCHTLFLSVDTYKCSVRPIYSVDLGRRRMIRLYASSLITGDCVILLQPSWPITVPSLPPNSKLYKHTHPRTN